MPVLEFDRDEAGREIYRIVITLEQGRMSFHPLEFTDRAEHDLIDAAAGVLADVRGSPIGSPLLAAAVQRRASLPQIIPVNVERAKFVFTQNSIEVPEMNFRVDDLPLSLTAKMTGDMRQSRDAPFEVRLTTPVGGPVVFPEKLTCIDAMPREVRETYYRFRPTGLCTLDLHLSRALNADRPEVLGGVRFEKGRFKFAEWPYPVYGATGELAFDRDPATHETRLRVVKIAGHGVPGTANELSTVRVDGSIQPLEGGSGVDLVVSGEGIHIDDAFRDAMPGDVRNAISIFKGQGDAPWPVATGDFACRVHRDKGPVSRWTYETDVTITSGKARCASSRCRSTTSRPCCT
ncbi:MAG: hypothetical protein QM770_14880 [Tepidisphaeraceae bacterium]